MNDIMFDPSRGPLRANIDHLDLSEIDRLRRANSIVADPMRQRPRYFDGRFLAAPDLTREQAYFMQRQADLARSSVPGVIHGLDVTAIGDTKLRISSGNGVTPAGELIVLTDAIEVDLANVAEIQLLDAAFGLDQIPNEPPRRRTGLFVLALRPVEYTANPTSSYPTSVTERRAVEDGEIIEAVAVTLVPYPDAQVERNAGQQRAQVARHIFVERASDGVPAEALPIAMIQLDRGFLLWTDSHMVRREVGPEHGGVAGFGAIPRALREAQVLQYSRHLEDIIAERARDGSPVPRFAASEYFRALPSAGTIPVETINRRGVLQYTQLYFPPQVRVLMSLIPEDEVAAAVEESMLLAPIDLMATSDELGFTWLLVLLPARRGELFAPHITRAVELAPATPGIVTRGMQLHGLNKFFPSQASNVTPSTSIDQSNETVLRNTFERVLTAGIRLWYVRRRALRARPERRHEVQGVDIGYVKGAPR